jgi:hypothetical protein
MSKNSTSGRGPRDRSDWSSAWEIVARLAAARATLQEIEHAPPPTPGGRRPRSQTTPAALVEPPRAANVELARAVAEIERAAAALRRSEPRLENWHPGKLAPREARRHRSVWLLIGGIWLSASLLVAGATGAVIYLLG